jgi:hypothetical protein
MLGGVLPPPPPQPSHLLPGLPEDTRMKYEQFKKAANIMVSMTFFTVTCTVECSFWQEGKVRRYMHVLYAINNVNINT